MKMVSAGFCESGSRAGVNQDTIGMFQKGESGLFFVADGMGGYSGGERASRTLADACGHWWSQYSGGEEKADFERSVNELKTALSDANLKVWSQTEKTQICGSTIVLLWIQGERYALIWSGDSRCYCTERRPFGVRVRQMTKDDVWENQPEIMRSCSRETQKRHPNYGKLVRAAGIWENFVCTVHTDSLREKTVFALCSDGVYKYGNPKALERQIKAAARADDMEGALGAVKADVYRNQAPDNLSCIFVKAWPK